jgi:ABC-2 type transport system ATP-binding protein
MSVIEIENLFKTFRGEKGRPVEALRGVSLKIEEGEVFGFLGPNGAGKSTSIKILTGLIFASGGSASLFGVPVSDSRSRNRIGYLPENPSFYDFLTAREYLKFVGKTYGMGKKKLESESERVLKLMGLHEDADRSMRGYSKGMVQRLGLAQALLHDPDLYILDEPMSGLDPLGRALVKDIIRDLKKRGKTVFFSTHITSDVEIVCDRVGIIAYGQLQTVDSVERILEAGIEGYYVKVSGAGDERLFDGMTVFDRSHGVKEIYVPQSDMKHLMEKVIQSGMDLSLIEPKRKDLEAFLLEVVSGGRK